MIFTAISRHCRYATGVLLLVIGHAPATALAATEPALERPRIALVLSGGGARGLAHIGVLQVLEELRVPVDCVVGASMGALVGGVYAAGLTPREMQESLAERNLASFFDDDPPRSEISSNSKRDDYRPLFGFAVGFNHGSIQLPDGAASGYKFELFLKELVGSGAATANQQFDDLPVPFRAVATDLESGAMQVFEAGDLTRVMRASMSLPGLLAPMIIDNRIYADGGLVRNLPVDVGRELCGDKVIAVNLGTPPKPREQLTDSFAVASQALVLLTEQNVQQSLSELGENDILIVPELGEFSSSDFADQQAIIERGSEAALQQRELLQTLALAPQQYRQWQAQRDALRPRPLQITRISAVSDGLVSDTAIMRDIRTPTDDHFETAQLSEDISHVFGRGDFSYIGYTLIPHGDNAEVVIDATAKPWGPGFLKFGFSAATDFNSPSQINVAASYNRNWLNSLGASWRTDAQIGYNSFLVTEFSQPLQLRDGAFLAAYLGASREQIPLYRDLSRIGEITVNQGRVGFDLGLSSTSGELRLGPYASYSDATADLGILTPFFSGEQYTQAGIRLSGIYDQLDSYAFPRAGILAQLDIDYSIPDWGSQADYLITRLAVSGAHSFGHHTFAANLEWGDDLSGENEVFIQDQFKLGGPMRLSGLFLDQLTGDKYSLATARYYNQYASLPSQLGRGLYVGMSLEGGRMDDVLSEHRDKWIGATGVFWGADTILGATMLGYGWSNINQSSWYLTLGRVF